ncbi:MAG: ribonuclease H family protein [Lachnospiraceae bacterium]|nr:ribonuclease H family protein [Lachnospiraceae bacterium]
MGNKFYAVKKGITPGIYTTWEECEANVAGYSKAEYKSFKTKNEALKYLGLDEIEDNPPKELPQKGSLLVYVDGSFEESINRYSFGCVFIRDNNDIRLAFGNGDSEEGLKSRNVSGEMLGAMYAVKCAMKNGFSSVTVCYDYLGIEKWAKGEWKTNTVNTTKYAKAMAEWSKSIKIDFKKVKAHSKVYYNELADETAKRGLIEGNGIPAVSMLDDMEKYEDA